MRILYGVQGTGNGHVSRARAMAPALAEQGCEVDFLFSGRPPEAYFDMEGFGAWRACKGVTFVVEQGKVCWWRSAGGLGLRRWWRDVDALSMRDYDLVITDFEPVTAWAARRAEVPSINLSHQAAFAYPMPARTGSRLLSTLANWYAPANYQMGLHWHHFGQPLLPPLIQAMEPDLASDAVSQEADKPGRAMILVYLPFERREVVQAYLQTQPGTRFVAYHPSVQTPEEQSGVEWRPLSRTGFLQALKQCEGVICNAGFELPSEALTLGRKLLVKPLAGQIEQQVNACALESLGLGMTMAALEPQALEKWLRLGPAEAVHYPPVAVALAEVISSGRWRDLEPLARELWTQVRFPSYLREPC